MNDIFDSLPWHDAELLELSVDRRNAGACDEVRLRVAWPRGDEATLLFRDCYAMTAEMNFGVIAEERIASASLIEDDPGLTSIRDRWKRCAAIGWRRLRRPASYESTPGNLKSRDLPAVPGIRGTMGTQHRSADRCPFLH